VKLAWFKLATRDGEGDVDLGVNPELVTSVLPNAAAGAVDVRLSTGERYTVRGDLGWVSEGLEHPSAPR
jgi:hypothetical protein